MKKIIIGLLGLFLAMTVKVHGMTLYSTLDTNSTEGNYFGALYFSFSSTNSSDYQVAGNGAYWSSIQDSQTFTDSISGSQIEAYFIAGGGEAGNEMNFFDIIEVSDPAFGSVYNSLSGNSLGGNDEQGGYFIAGQPRAFSYVSTVTSQFYSDALNFGGDCTFGYTLTGNFNGISGSASGSWFVTYPVPEPTVTLQLVVGGFCLWLVRARNRFLRSRQ